jgi:hypothetical protein
MIPLSLADLEITADFAPQKCELTLRLHPEFAQRATAPASLKWSGKLRGPFCLRSQTLAANYPVRPIEDSAASVIVPDCCYWTSDLPFTYDLDIELRSGDEPWAALKETISLPWLKLHQGKLYRSAKRWAPRMVRLELPPMQSEQERAALPAWLEAVRQHDLALVLSLAEASNELLIACRRVGVPVAVEGADIAPHQLAAWENSGAVFLLLHPAVASPDTHLLIAHPAPENAGANWECWEVQQRSEATGVGRVAARRGTFHTPAEARKACDALQADSAGSTDWLGYLIH